MRSLTDAKPIMDAIIRLIETYLKTGAASKHEFKKVSEMMDAYYKEFAKKNPHASAYNSQLAIWMIHEQEFLPGTPYTNGGPPSYFWDEIESAQD